MSVEISIPRIHALAPALYNQIAAGEVIERPASVVKELLENALDAGADNISVQLEQAGTALIRLVDNGHGIHPEDMSLVLQSHATSKLLDSAGLNAIDSFGFRGEALASIASIAELTLCSSADDSKQGLQLQFLADRALNIEPCARTRGTTIEVRRLFFNTPARKKFLRANNTEYQHILAIFKAIALCEFDCAFKLQHNQKATMRLRSAAKDETQRVRDICGTEFIKHASRFEFNHDEMRLWGWLGHTEAARHQTDRQYLYINRRFVRDKHIQHAIRLAYQDLLYPGRHPCYVMFLELPPSRFDVNVHPGKQEVRFQQPRDLHDFVYHCLSQVLSQQATGSVQSLYSGSLSPTAEGAVAAHETFSGNEVAVEERVVEYRQATKTSQSMSESVSSLTNDVVFDNRYIVYPQHTGLLLVDIHKARESWVLETLAYQYQRKQRVISRPLLIPFEYQNRPTIIDQLEAGQATLVTLGFHCTRSAPEQLMIRELPESVRYLDIRRFLDDVVDVLAVADEKLAIESCIALIASHSNDQLPERLSAEESRQLLQFCSKRKLSKHPGQPNFCRLLDVDTLQAIIKGA